MPFAETYVSGRVTLDGKPVAAEVRFPGGSGSGVANPHTGEYFALLSRPYRAGPVYVVACDESFVYLHHPSDERLASGPGYDLQIPANEMIIHVRDQRTDEVVSDAAASLWLVKPEDAHKVVGGIPAVQVGDYYRVAHLEEGRTVVACAEKDGYRRSCTDPLTVRMKTDSVTVKLSPLDRSGRVHAIGYRTIYWVRPDGTISESAPINEEGEFHYADDHPMDHLVLTGSGPLWVTKIEEPPGEVLELYPPTSPRRQIRFQLGEANPKKNSIVLLWINGLPVPVRAFASHQIGRGQQWLMANRAPIVVADLFVSDRIAVAEGPDPEVAPGVLDEGVSLFVGRTPTEVIGSEFVFGSEADMTFERLSR